MALNLSSFRTSAFAITTAASLALSANFAALTGFSSPAHAAGSPACAKITDPAQNLICEIRESERRTREANQRGAEARRQGAEADRRGAEADKQLQITLGLEACMDYIKDNTGKKFSREAILTAANGKLSRDNVCDVARKFGYGQRAALN